MKRKTWSILILAVLFLMQIGASATYAAPVPVPVLLDPRDGMYLMRIINLTREQLSIAVAKDNSNPAFVTPAFTSPANFNSSVLYSPGMNQSSTALLSQQNVFSPTPIKLDTLFQRNSQKAYQFPPNTALPYWEGMINLTPLIPASNENNTYMTYSGHFSQGQRMTITTVNNPQSILNGAYIQLGYNYTEKTSIIWKNVFDFAFSTISNAADLAAACEDGNVADALSAGASEIKTIAQAVQQNPVTASLNSAATLTTQPTTSQTSYFTDATVTNYAQAMAFFTAPGGGSVITDMSQNNQLYTLASAKQMVVALKASDNSVRYFTAPAYYIYIKNVEAAQPGEINQCTIALVEGWVYNLAVGMYQYTQPAANGGRSGSLATLQGLNPLQLMYYAGSSVQPLQPVPASSYAAEPAIKVSIMEGKTAQPVKITGVTISYIGG